MSWATRQGAASRGNNNAYCYDNERSWFDWNLLSKHADVVRFVKLLIKRRTRRDVEHEHRRTTLEAGPAGDEAHLSWRETESAGLVPLFA